MNVHSKYNKALNWTVIFCFGILPIINQIHFLMISTSKTPLSIVPSPISLYMGFIALVYYINFIKNDTHTSSSIMKMHINIGNVLFTVGILLSTSMLLQCVGLFIFGQNTSEYLKPNGVWQYFLLYTGCICSAFFEEVFYRFYLPEALKKLIPLKKGLIIEIIAIAIFSLGHIYLGILGVIIGFIAGVTLRRCVIKTECIVYSFAAHLFYNAFMLFIMLL